MKRLLYVYPSPDSTEHLVGPLPDIVVVDLEEAVAQSDKAEARNRLEATVAALSTLGVGLVVRVNGFGSPHMHDNLVAVGSLPADVGLLLPKPLNLAIIQSISEAHSRRPIWLMAESGDTGQWLPEVLSKLPIAGLVIGGKDLCLDFGLEGYQPANILVRNFVDHVVDLARPFRIDVFDAVAFGENGVRQAIVRAVASGCVGLSLIRARDLHVCSGT